ncbi:MAG: hypothetical protein FJ297_12245 [Planctomycetes bacterium]|nr:hypothetical protein [Planctomycetota bacterium]
MRAISTFACFAGVALLPIATLFWPVARSTDGAAAQETRAGKDASSDLSKKAEASNRATEGADKGQGKAKQPLEMVEGDMHEFMGHVYEPLYGRLRQSLSSKPVSDEQWKQAASDALIIAEVGNLLLLRSPDESNKAWTTNATGIRTFGGLVYRAVREKDYQNAVFHYRHMIEQCNDCHRQFGSPDMHIDP